MSSTQPNHPLEHALGYAFQSSKLLTQALTHRSRVGAAHNERLEFLGDAVLGHVVAQWLYRCYPNATEGELTRLRAMLVCGQQLSVLADDLLLGQYLRLGMGERKSGGRRRQSILADTLEAIIGAIYLDGGFSACEAVIHSLFGRAFHALDLSTAVKDAKSRLQEWAQLHQHPLPQYITSTSGPPHAPQFHVDCSIPGLPHQSTGDAGSRRDAEQRAAEAYLESLNDT